MSWDRLSKHKHAGGLGFRNFRDFNLVMPGKQGWRLILNPDGLVARVYKAHYFADTDFLNSKLGNIPNFIWKSIFAAKDVIRLGVKWRIGLGKEISIQNQTWLDDKENPYITTVSPSLEEKIVSYLMCMDKRDWDMNIVNDIFNERDQRAILQTRLEENNEQDTINRKQEQT